MRIRVVPFLEEQDIALYPEVSTFLTSVTGRWMMAFDGLEALQTTSALSFPTARAHYCLYLENPLGNPYFCRDLPRLELEEQQASVKELSLRMPILGIGVQAFLITLKVTGCIYPME